MENVVLVSSFGLWILVFINFMITLALVKRIRNLSDSQRQETEMLQVGSLAPDFTATTLDGKTVTRPDYSEREQALVFVLPGCGPCREKMPELQEMYPKAKKAGVDLSIVSLGDFETTKAYVQEFNYSIPFLIAPRENNPLMIDYRVSETPSYYLIDRLGKITSAGHLDNRWEALTKKWRR